jgi:hypothetical protein
MEGRVAPREDNQCNHDAAGGLESRPLLLSIHCSIDLFIIYFIHRPRCKSIGTTMIATMTMPMTAIPFVEPGVETASCVAVGVAG